MEDLRELISFSGLFHYFVEEKDRSSHLALFHQQKLPGILLNTNICRNFRKEGLPFETGFYPLYDISGNFMLLPMTMQIQNRLETFYQSVQFFQFVQSENVQEFFAREEFVTLQGKFRGTADFCPEEKRSCIFTGDPYINYMMGSVIRLELFCRAIQKKEPAEALENIFAYPRIIRNSFPEK